VPALLNTKFEPNGFVFVVIRCKPAGVISWRIVPNTNQEDGWRANPASFESGAEELQCGAEDTQLMLSIPALSLSKKTRYYLYFKADTSPILNAPYAFAVPDEYSCKSNTFFFAFCNSLLHLMVLVAGAITRLPWIQCDHSCGRFRSADATVGDR